jgi:hypothetical protein
VGGEGLGKEGTAVVPTGGAEMMQENPDGKWRTHYVATLEAELGKVRGDNLTLTERISALEVENATLRKQLEEALRTRDEAIAYVSKEQQIAVQMQLQRNQFREQLEEEQARRVRVQEIADAAIIGKAVAEHRVEELCKQLEEERKRTTPHVKGTLSGKPFDMPLPMFEKLASDHIKELEQQRDKLCKALARDSEPNDGEDTYEDVHGGHQDSNWYDHWPARFIGYRSNGKDWESEAQKRL